MKKIFTVLLVLLTNIIMVSANASANESAEPLNPELYEDLSNWISAQSSGEELSEKDLDKLVNEFMADPQVATAIEGIQESPGKMQLAIDTDDNGEEIEAVLAGTGKGVKIIISRSSKRMTITSPAGTESFPISAGGGRKCPKAKGRKCYNASTPARSGVTGQMWPERRWSNAFKTWMPVATHLFGGIFIHVAPPGTEKFLGNANVSGNCIRTTRAGAKYVQSIIRKYGRASFTIR